ncbi:hypothetical protein [Adhaeribacter rhizoryzae]|uniref:DoxX family protein n=1 Tax=Adhaeribacter rhizoryzae TaxID=2607907 RepID=A0A5M6DAI7_9BACT|nr:hypothetical protein [Adhaeribacter rhizoryzae]KAA5542999.1 hypothetical protein F0145_17865 [Adhaeribacter rhizoryzae]
MYTLEQNQATMEREPVTSALEQPAADRPAPTPWHPFTRFSFRVAFIFFVLMSIPNNPEWYTNLFSIDWLHVHYRDIYDIARFQPSFVRGIPGIPSLLGYADWFAALAIALAGAGIWTALDRKRVEYNILYYWLRVIVRYRAGIGIIGFGFTKLFPVQMPYPSLGLLHTNFGDFTAQKIYWLSIGIVPWYQVFAGIVEVAAGALLFYRRTTFLGAVLLFGALGDIVYVNFAYDGGVHGYSSYFVLYAAFLMLYDVPRIYRLLIQERLTIPVHYYPSFAKGWLKYSRYALKTATLVIFLGILFYAQYINFRYDPYKQPSTPGVAKLRGAYQVTEFRLNNQVIPYNPLDSTRWQDVTFEKWTSLTYKVNKATLLDLSNGGGSPMKDLQRTFEATGVAGGQRVFHYYADTLNQVLYLQDKVVDMSAFRNQNGRGNRADRNQSPNSQKSRVKPAPADNWIPAAALANIGDENTKIDKRAWSTRRNREFAEPDRPVKRNRMVLKYSTPTASRIILRGIDERKDSVLVVLDKVDREYTLSESTLVAGQY